MGLELPVWGAPTVVWTVTALGLVGASVLDRFLDGDGSDDDDSGGMGDDDPFGGGMGGGGMGGGGMGGGGMGGDGLDDFDGMDEWDDGFDDGSGGGGGADTDELEKRLDDLENEVASLSSTVSTVRSENEEISAAVDDIEEDVRNLLDIYEMVTRGINPFVDDSSGFDSVSGGGEGSFGLFDDEEEEKAAGDDLDEDVANADADGFFDDEILDDDFEDDFEEGGFEDDLDELDEGPDGDHTDDGDSAGAASETGAADDEDAMNDDGKSFSELKEEYDAGEADWADENGSDDADATADDDPFDDDLGDETDPFDDAFGDGSADAGFEDEEPTPEPKAEPEPEPAAERSRELQPGGDPAEASGDGFEYVQKDDLSGSRGKPYLTELPGDYVGDLLVMEWLEFLVSESDVTDAVRAINYYERIEWVGPDAAARLRDFLSGFGTIDRNLVDRPGTDRLVREHHTRSLRYVTQLNGTSGHLLLLDRWDDLAGGSLVGGGPPAFGGGHGRGRRDDRRQRDDRGRRGDNGHRDDRGRLDERRASRNHDDGHESGRDARDDHAGRDESGHAGHSERDRRANGHERNGGSPRPMNDPNPRSDRADPVDGGWGDGR